MLDGGNRVIYGMQTWANMKAGEEKVKSAPAAPLESLALLSASTVPLLGAAPDTVPPWPPEPKEADGTAACAEPAAAGPAALGA